MRGKMRNENCILIDIRTNDLALLKDDFDEFAES
jgi:hypothetical protein